MSDKLFVISMCEEEFAKQNEDTKQDILDSELVLCRNCRWYDNGYGDVCHNPRYGDGHANYLPPYVDEDYFCKDGERKGGDNATLEVMMNENRRQ